MKVQKGESNEKRARHAAGRGHGRGACGMARGRARLRAGAPRENTGIGAGAPRLGAWGPVLFLLACRGLSGPEHALVSSTVQ